MGKGFLTQKQWKGSQGKIQPNMPYDMLFKNLNLDNLKINRKKNLPKNDSEGLLSLIDKVSSQASNKLHFSKL